MEVHRYEVRVTTGGGLDCVCACVCVVSVPVDELPDDDESPEDEYPGQPELSSPLLDGDEFVVCELDLRAVAFSALTRAPACFLGPSTGSWPAAI
jgi:hypothetical protein